MVTDRTGFTADKRWLRGFRAAGLTLSASLLLSAGTLVQGAMADDKLAPILILPGQAPQTVTGEPPQTPPEKPAAAAQPAPAPSSSGDEPAVVISPAPSQAPASGGSDDEPAVVISPAPSDTPIPSDAPAASGTAEAAPQPGTAESGTAESGNAEDDEPAVVISPAPGTQAPAEQPKTQQEQQASDDEPAVVISPAPSAKPEAAAQPAQQQQAQSESDEPEQENLPDEAPVDIGAEPSTENPAADKAADQGEDMEPVGDTTQVLYASDGGVDVPIDSTETLETLAQQLAQDGNARVQIYGYATSPDGSENAARRLALQRAQAVRAYLVEKGIPVSRFTIRPQGIATDGGPPDRVDIVLLHP